jgi:hypothetical protein
MQNKIIMAGIILFLLAGIGIILYVKLKKWFPFLTSSENFISKLSHEELDMELLNLMFLIEFEGLL